MQVSPPIVQAAETRPSSSKIMVSQVADSATPAPGTTERSKARVAEARLTARLRPDSEPTRTAPAALPSRRPAVTTLQPLRLLLLAVAGWVHREQAAAIVYLQEENRVLREQVGGRRLRLTDAQRRRLAAKGAALGRRLLARVATIVTSDTILRWHRRLIAEKWTRPTKRTGRPGLMKAIRELIVALANDNPTWGYCRIQGERGHTVARSTVAKTQREHGVPPSPERPTSWSSFLRAHAGAIAATDFFSAEVWTARGLVTHYVLFVIDHATHAVEIAGITTSPDSPFMAQVARNLTDAEDSFLRAKRFLVLDNDTKFTEQFRRILGDAGVTPVATAIQAPNMNAIAERFVGSIKREGVSSDSGKSGSLL